MTVRTGSGLIGKGMAFGQLPGASKGDLMAPSKVLIQKLPQMSLIPHQQEPGTSPEVGMSSQITLLAIESKLKPSPKKGIK